MQVTATEEVLDFDCWLNIFNRPHAILIRDNGSISFHDYTNVKFVEPEPVKDH